MIDKLKAIAMLPFFIAWVIIAYIHNKITGKDTWGPNVQ